MDAERLIQSDEGRSLDAYLDKKGIPTIGIGHTGPEVHLGLAWTDEQVDAAFAADYAHAKDGISHALPWFPRLDAVRQAYVINMAFQMGVHGVLEFVHTLGALRDQRWHDAAGGVRDSDWHKQTPLRAERCARAFETGAWQSQ